MKALRTLRGTAAGRTVSSSARSRAADARKLARRIVGIIGMAVAAAVVVSGCSEPAEAQEAPGSIAAVQRGASETRVPVRVTRTERDRFVEYGEYFGEARGSAEAILSAGLGGRVSTVAVTEGDEVAAGDSLAQIEPERARILYETAVLNERLARENWERERRFLSEGNSFQLRVDQANLAWLQARADLLDAERMLEGARAITPIAGTVVASFIEPHDRLDPDDPTFHVADLSTMTITVGVPESDIAGVQQLDEAEVVFTALPDRTFAGRAVGFARTRTERTLSYDVEIQVDNVAREILSGQTARVRLALRSFPDVVAVPSSAIFTRNDGSYVFVVRDERVVELPVRLGVSNDTRTVILAGLESGENLVVEGINRLADGSPVEIVQ